MVWGFKSCNFVHSANARPFVLRFLPFEFPSRRHLELWRNRAVPCPDPTLVNVDSLFVNVFFGLTKWKLIVRGNMPQCAAADCLNRAGVSSKKGISLHRLPDLKREDIWHRWLIALGRCEEELPSDVCVCSIHFEENCFDNTFEVKRKLGGCSSKAQRQLRPDAVPTIFKHKAVPKPRVTSVLRAEKRKLAEVGGNWMLHPEFMIYKFHYSFKYLEGILWRIGLPQGKLRDLISVFRAAKTAFALTMCRSLNALNKSSI